MPFPDYPYLHRCANELQFNKQNIILKSRQMLISWLLAAKAVWQCTFFPYSDVPIISRVEDVAKELKDRSFLIYDNLPEFLKLYATSTTFKMDWPNNHTRILSMSCTEDAARSFSASGVIIDEGAFLKWGSLMYGSIRPIIDQYGWIDICSTPNGQDALFHHLWHSKNERLNKIIVHWRDHPLRDDAWAEAMRADIGEARWMREYELSFATPAGKQVYAGYWTKAMMLPCYSQWEDANVIIRGWDRGFHRPATVWTFMNRQDQFCIGKSHLGEDVTRDDYIKDIVEKSESAFPGADFIDWVPADFGQKESDGKTWRDTMKRHGITPKVGRAGRDEVPRRVDSVRQLMKVRQDGNFAMLVDPSCRTLVEGFDGGYHYPEKINKPEDEKPEKDGYFDHEQNALEVITDNHFAKPEAPKTRRVLPKRKFNSITGRPE